MTCANASSASSAERRVEQLRLAGQDLVGTLPAKLAELTRLKLLDLGENMLEGPVPLELGKMASLESLDLHQNNLNGTVPESLRDLKNLHFLELSHNNFEGVLLSLLDSKFSQKSTLSPSSLLDIPTAPHFPQLLPFPDS